MSNVVASDPGRMAALPARLLRILSTGIVGGLLASAIHFSPLGQAIEADVVRGWIFKLRGPRPPPPGVNVVSMDAAHADRETYSPNGRKWNRYTYASLLERLSALGAHVVVFDVTFEVPTTEAEDAAFESAIARSDRAVLFKRLARVSAGDVVVPPLTRFAAASRATGVFPLPKVPSRVDYYWPFFSALEPAAEAQTFHLVEVPSLPVAALQLRLARAPEVDEIDSVLRDELAESTGAAYPGLKDEGNLDALTEQLRRALGSTTGSGPSPDDAGRERSESSDRARRLLGPLLEVYRGSGVRYLNFYGPARSIPTFDHPLVLASPENGDDASLRDAVSGSVVFVGHSSRSAVDQEDGFRTVFSNDSGIDLGGVEIASTAYANLLDGSTLRVPSPIRTVGMHVALGVLVAAVSLCRPLVASAAVALLGGLLFAAAVMAVRDSFLLLPVGTGLLLQLPAMLFACLLVRFLVTSRQRDRYERGVSRLLPRTAITDIERAASAVSAPARVHAVCMITDVAGYTRLSESVSERQLSDLSSEYYALLSSVVIRHGGEIVDIEGDSMTCVWIESEAERSRTSPGCRAALGIQEAIAEFNRHHPGRAFTTRVGLNRGWAMYGMIGGGGTFRFRLVGDMVNTASRLEGLNKRLGTSVLAARTVIPTTDDMLIRDIGTFALRGKRETTEVVELVGPLADASARERELCRRFDEAMERLIDRGAASSTDLFGALARDFPDDRPSRLYAGLRVGAKRHGLELLDDGTIAVLGK